jgi:hypothetical protein
VLVREARTALRACHADFQDPMRPSGAGRSVCG